MLEFVIDFHSLSGNKIFNTFVEVEGCLANPLGRIEGRVLRIDVIPWKCWKRWSEAEHFGLLGQTHSFLVKSGSTIFSLIV